jgi:hypothetical protein
MSNSFALREYTIPPRRENRSPLGFSNKSAKKSRNFRCYAQKPSKLPRSCPTCWDVTKGSPGSSRKELWRKHEIQAAASYRRKIGGGNHCRNCLRSPLLLHQRLHLALHHERGVVHPLDYGFVVVTWSNLSMYCHC